MKKRPGPAINPTAFSNAGQFTSPPFSVALESAELRRRLLEEMLHPAGAKTGKAAGQRRNKKPRK
jgi:hypothetical protein